ncbi:hypothetical protein K474DRAFT_1522265 [Panus rudis PR-1116 ss-1]|nr:hypothetical protein K474DRAFT_1522265 [Panus rudis PR-1116 ss-1]
MLLSLPAELITIIVTYLLDNDDDVPLHFRPIRVLSQVNRALYNFTYPFRFYRVTLADAAEYRRFLAYFTKQGEDGIEYGVELQHVRHIRIGRLEKADVWGYKESVIWLDDNSTFVPPMSRLQSLQCYFHSNSVQLLWLIRTTPTLRRISIIWRNSLDILLLLSAAPLEDVRLVLSNAGEASENKEQGVAAIEDRDDADTETGQDGDSDAGSVQTASDIDELPGEVSPASTQVGDHTQYRSLTRLCITTRGIGSLNIHRICSLRFPSLRSFHLSEVYIPRRMIFLFVARHPMLTDLSMSFVTSATMFLSAAIDLAAVSYSSSDCARIAEEEETVPSIGRRTNPVMLSQQIVVDGFSFERDVHAMDDGVRYTVTAFGAFVPHRALPIELEYPHPADIVGAINI